MSVDRAPAMADYWNTRKDKSIYFSIQEAMAQRRFEQIKRYFRISNHLEDPHSTSPHWWKKQEPLATDVRTVSAKCWDAGSHVSVDRQAIGFHGRSLSTMQS